MSAPELFPEGILAIGEVDIGHGIGGSRGELSVELGFRLTQLVIVKADGRHHIAEDLALAVLLHGIAIFIHIDDGVFFIIGSPDTHVELRMRELQRRSPQRIFLRFGEVWRNAQDAFAKAESRLPGAVEICIFHHQAFAEGSPVMAQIQLQPGVVQQRQLGIFIAGIVFGILDDFLSRLVLYPLLAFAAVVHKAELEVFAPAGTQLHGDIGVHSVQVEVAPVAEVFLVWDGDAAIAVAAAQEGLVQHIVAALFKIARIILQRGIKEETVLHRWLFVIHVIAQVCITVVSEPHRIAQVSHLGNSITSGRALEDCHSFDGRHIGQTHKLFKMHAVDVVRRHQIIFPNIRHTFGSAFIAIQTLDQIANLISASLSFIRLNMH